jgi:hypothetical protein
MTVPATTTPADSVRWVRAPRVPSATRTDGISLALSTREGRWVSLVKGVPHPLSTPPAAYVFESAVDEVDRMFPPAPWSYRDGVWVADLWHVVPDGGDTWSVYRSLDGFMERASQQSFPTADRARRWAELRFDRGTQGLRGPKPRAGKKSGARLPDVRMTEEERSHILSTLESRGLSYSDFVRAAFAWIEESLGDEGAWDVSWTPEGPARFVPRPSPVP